MRKNLDDSQIEDDLDEPALPDPGSLATDLTVTPDPVFLALEHDWVHSSTAHPDPVIRLHDKREPAYVRAHLPLLADSRRTSGGILAKTLLAERHARSLGTHNYDRPGQCSSFGQSHLAYGRHGPSQLPQGSFSAS